MSEKWNTNFRIIQYHAKRGDIEINIDRNLGIADEFGNYAYLVRCTNRGGEPYSMIDIVTKDEVFEVFSAPQHDEAGMLECFQEVYQTQNGKCPCD